MWNCIILTVKAKDMYDYISGRVAELTPTNAVIDNNGIGYDISITLLDYSELHYDKVEKLYIHESIREDAHQLYGFITQKGRELFRLLIGVSGVGPNTARLILSALSVEQLQNVIASGDHKALKCVKGIGARTAERIIVDLRDKIKTDEMAFNTSVNVAAEAYDDALAALVMLGFTTQASQKALKKVFEAHSGISTEKAIKQALKML